MNSGLNYYFLLRKMKYSVQCATAVSAVSYYVFYIMYRRYAGDTQFPQQVLIDFCTRIFIVGRYRRLFFRFCLIRCR